MLASLWEKKNDTIALKKIKYCLWKNKKIKNCSLYLWCSHFFNQALLIYDITYLCCLNMELLHHGQNVLKKFNHVLMSI